MSKVDKKIEKIEETKENLNLKLKKFDDAVLEVEGDQRDPKRILQRLEKSVLGKYIYSFRDKEGFLQEGFTSHGAFWIMSEFEKVEMLETLIDMKQLVPDDQKTMQWIATARVRDLLTKNVFSASVNNDVFPFRKVLDDKGNVIRRERSLFPDPHSLKIAESKAQRNAILKLVGKEITIPLMTIVKEKMVQGKVRAEEEEI